MKAPANLFLIVLALAAALEPRAAAQPTPVLTWVPGSSIKKEQIIGDVDWAALAQGSNVPTASLTVTNFHILGTGEGYTFEDHGHLLFLSGDTISDDTNTWRFQARDPLGWCTNTDGESPLVVNYFTNRPYNYYRNTPIFVEPNGIEMGGNDIPNAGISLSNGVFLIWALHGVEWVNLREKCEF
jgi:hypothetical protein